MLLINNFVWNILDDLMFWQSLLVCWLVQWIKGIFYILLVGYRVCLRCGMFGKVNVVLNNFVFCMVYRVWSRTKFSDFKRFGQFQFKNDMAQICNRMWRGERGAGLNLWDVQPRKALNCKTDIQWFFLLW